MGTVAVLVDNRAAAAALRRTLPHGMHSFLWCRGGGHLARALESRFLEALVLGWRALRVIDWRPLRQRFPGVPLVVFGAFRPDDGARLLELCDGAAAAVLLEGMDDPLLGDAVARLGLTSRRARALRDGPRVLRLSEPLQRAAWEVMVRHADAPLGTQSLARRLGVSREHLSRQFGAGGAPNLKRVSDLLRVTAARELLANPGHTPARAARVLGYSSPGHLRSVVRRVTRLRPADLPGTPVPELLRRFVRGGMRSRG